MLEADSTMTNVDYGVEYHVWPALAPTAWLMLAQQPTPPLRFPSVGCYASVVSADKPELFYDSVSSRGRPPSIPRRMRTMASIRGVE